MSKFYVSVEFDCERSRVSAERNAILEETYGVSSDRAYGSIGSEDGEVTYVSFLNLTVEEESEMRAKHIAMLVALTDSGLPVESLTGVRAHEVSK